MNAKAAFLILVPLSILGIGQQAPASQAKTIVAQPSGECTLSVESNDTWRTLRLRAHHPEGRYCRIGKEEMLAVLASAFSKTESPKLEGTYTSLFIGRLVDFPWLSHYLALAALNDPRWDSTKHPPEPGPLNKYVSDILSRKEVTAELEAPFAAAGYRITGASVEKVLVGTARDLSFYEGQPFSGTVPYDAQVWFKLERRISP